MNKITELKNRIYKHTEEQRARFRAKWHKDKHKKKETSKEYYSKNKAKWIEKFKKSRTKNPEKVKARQAVRHLVHTGKIIKLPCQKCGDKLSEGHHEDYTKPLEVIWLCHKHHTELHMIKKSLSAEENFKNEQLTDFLLEVIK